MTQLKPTVVQSLNVIAQDINFIGKGGNTDATSLVFALLLLKEPIAAIKFAIGRTRSVEALTLLTFAFVTALKNDDDALLALISEISFARYGVRPRKSTGEILEMYAQEKIDLIWHLLLPKEEKRRVEILTNAAIDTN